MISSPQDEANRFISKVVMCRMFCWDYPRAKPRSIPAKLRVRNAVKRFSCGEAQAAVGAGEFLHKLEIPKSDHQPEVARKAGRFPLG